MKKTGLSNRFSQKTRYEWLDWYSCLICRMNQQDALHHIVSPSSRHYVAGDHNKSVLNSCPIHNQKCHVGNEAHLNKDETITKLLNEVWDIMVCHQGHVMNENDGKFQTIYAHLYTGGRSSI